MHGSDTREFFGISRRIGVFARKQLLIRVSLYLPHDSICIYYENELSFVCMYYTLFREFFLSKYSILSRKN